MLTPQINRQNTGSAILVCTKATESPKIHTVCAVITSPTLILEEEDTDVQNQLTSGARVFTRTAFPIPALQ